MARTKRNLLTKKLTTACVRPNEVGRASERASYNMAHTKAIGTSANGRDSQPSYLGVKLSQGQAAKIGNIIIRQHGTKYLPGSGVRLGRDYTIYAMTPGTVKFTTKRKTGFNGDRRIVKLVSVIPN